MPARATAAQAVVTGAVAEIDAAVVNAATGAVAMVVAGIAAAGIAVETEAAVASSRGSSAETTFLKASNPLGDFEGGAYEQ